MLKTKIIAADLQNLTDARYFAAWLVDYMSFNLSEESANLSKIKEIMDNKIITPFLSIKN